MKFAHRGHRGCEENVRMARSIRTEFPALEKAGWPRHEENIPGPLIVIGADGVVRYYHRLIGALTNRLVCALSTEREYFIHARIHRAFSKAGNSVRMLRAIRTSRTRS
jgi:hypothetical protein